VYHLVIAMPVIKEWLLVLTQTANRNRNEWKHFNSNVVDSG
jgi:6-phosphogluconate dehydrogenase (decarboxylating)